MKTNSILLIAAACCALSNHRASGQGFDSGSDGSMGALHVTTDNTTLTVPPDGKFHFTTVTIDASHELKFTRNAMNTPVYLLATGDVILAGGIRVSGEGGVAIRGGLAGPGGFDGGPPNGGGKGPGGGGPGADGNVEAGAGSGTYSMPANLASTNQGRVYGSPLLVPIVGGSGGGGSPSFGGGGGGGALLIASGTRIELRSGVAILCRGGAAFVNFGILPNAGSGGAVRLVAPVVSGSGSIDVRSDGGEANLGRVRIDAIDRTALGVTVPSGGAGIPEPLSVGSFMTVFPPGNARLDIVEAAGTAIPEGTNAPVTISLPFGSDPNRNVVVQARNFNAAVPVEVVLTPDNGLPIKVQTQIDNAAANPATVTVPVTFPINTPVAVNAWVR